MRVEVVSGGGEGGHLGQVEARMSRCREGGRESKLGQGEVIEEVKGSPC